MTRGNKKREDGMRLSVYERTLLLALSLLFMFPFDYVAVAQRTAVPQYERESLAQDSTVFVDAGVAIPVEENDSIAPTVVQADDYPYGLDGQKPFNPSPQRAVWMSALFPGLGQIYNRRYWKLPIVVGGFMGLGYATNWNNNQYQDYVQAYRDILDNDPSTKSYMDFFAPTVKEEDLDKAWLQQTLKSRKDYFRRNRDLCIICLVALYLVCMVDAYVDASMAHFDISPNLSMDLSPTMLIEPGRRRPALGLNWAFNF